MDALVAAAKKEGALNVIALPPTWANYGAILSALSTKYGIKINSALPDASGQQEIDAVKSESGRATAPDVLDVSMPVALANTSLFAPYQVSTWSDIPPPEGVERPVVPGLRRLHGDRLLEQVRHHHLTQRPAQPGVQGRGRAERQPDVGARRAERRDDGQHGRRRVGQQHRERRHFFEKLKKAVSRSRRPTPRSRRAPPRSCSTGTTSICRATSACRTGRCSSRRTPSWVGTTPRPSTRTHRTRPRPGCGRSSSTRRPPRAGRTSGSKGAAPAGGAGRDAGQWFHQQGRGGQAARGLRDSHVPQRVPVH